MAQWLHHSRYQCGRNAEDGKGKGGEEGYDHQCCNRDDDIHHLLINVFYILSWRKLIIVTVASLSPVRGLAGVEVSAGDPEITEVSAWASRAAGDIKVVPPV